MEKINFENLPSTNTPINATNLNQLQTNVENYFKNFIEMKGALQSGISFDDLITSGESTCYAVSGGNNTSALSGFPAGAYNYGMILTLNPTSSTSPTNYSTVQIYINDGVYSSNANANRGVYIRTRAGSSWVRLSGIESTSVQ